MGLVPWTPSFAVITLHVNDAFLIPPFAVFTFHVTRTLPLLCTHHVRFAHGNLFYRFLHCI